MYELAIVKSGVVVKLDDEDADLSQVKWHVKDAGVCRSAEGRELYMHRVIWERHNGPLERKQKVLHRDGDRLNNQSGNLFLPCPGDIQAYRKAYYQMPAVKERQKEQRRNSRTIHSEGAKTRKAEKEKERLAGLWFQVFNTYSWKCDCCGEDNTDFLTLDHVMTDGVQDRMGKCPQAVLRNAVAAKDPSRYRVLCFNCNCGRYHRGTDGKCPHHQASKMKTLILAMKK